MRPNSVDGQRGRPSGVMRFDLLKVVGSSPAFLARPDAERPGAGGEAVEGAPDLRVGQHRGGPPSAIGSEGFGPNYRNCNRGTIRAATYRCGRGSATDNLRARHRLKSVPGQGLLAAAPFGAHGGRGGWRRLFTRFAVRTSGARPSGRGRSVAPRSTHRRLYPFLDREQVTETAARAFCRRRRSRAGRGRGGRARAGAEMGAVARGRAVPASLWRADARRVLWVKPLPLGGDGRHVFPELEP